MTTVTHPGATHARHSAESLERSRVCHGQHGRTFDLHGFWRATRCDEVSHGVDLDNLPVPTQEGPGDQA